MRVVSTHSGVKPRDNGVGRAFTRSYGKKLLDDPEGPDGSRRADLAPDEAVAGRSGLSLQPVAPPAPALAPGISTRPAMLEIFASASCVIFGELERLRQKVFSGEALTEEDSKAFARYVRAACDLSREERAQLDAFDPSELSEEDLRFLMSQAGEVLDGQA